MDPQHALNSDQSATGTLRVRIKRFDGFGKLLPGKDALHVLQEPLLAGLHAEFPKAVSQGLLLHVLKDPDFYARGPNQIAR